MKYDSLKIKRKPLAEINVVPYIDVMLVLLIIFMVTAPLLNQGVKVNLPKADASAFEQKNHEPIIVSINANGQYFVNIAAQPESALTPEAIAELVQETLKKDNVANSNTEARAVLVKADQQINYGLVVKMMSLLQKAGASSVGLITDQPSASTKTSSASKDGNAWRDVS